MNSLTSWRAGPRRRAGIWVDNNGEREKARLIGMDTPESPKSIGCRELPALSGVLGPAARAYGVLFPRSGFRLRWPRLSAGTGLSAPDVDRSCEISVIPDVVANIDALAATRTYTAVSGTERRAAKRIGATISVDLGSIPQIPCGGVQKGLVGLAQSCHQRSFKRAS